MRDRIEIALGSKNHATELLELAKILRDEGADQLELYLLYSDFQQSLDSNDPRYVSIVDTMDLIYGGPWAKGNSLYTTVLTDNDISERQNK